MDEVVITLTIRAASGAGGGHGSAEDISRAQQCQSKQGRAFYDDVFIGSVCNNAPDDYSEGRIQNRKQGRPLTREQELELPFRFLRKLNAVGTKIDTCHSRHEVGEVVHQSLVEASKSLYVMFKMYKPDGYNRTSERMYNAVRAGKLSELSLTSREYSLRDAPHVTTRVEALRVALCRKGARSGTRAVSVKDYENYKADLPDVPHTLRASASVAASSDPCDLYGCTCRLYEEPEMNGDSKGGATVAHTVAATSGPNGTAGSNSQETNAGNSSTSAPPPPPPPLSSPPPPPPNVGNTVRAGQPAGSMPMEGQQPPMQSMPSAPPGMNYPAPPPPHPMSNMMMGQQQQQQQPQGMQFGQPQMQQQQQPLLPPSPAMPQYAYHIGHPILPPGSVPMLPPNVVLTPDQQQQFHAMQMANRSGPLFHPTNTADIMRSMNNTFGGIGGQQQPGSFNPYAGMGYGAQQQQQPQQQPQPQPSPYQSYLPPQPQQPPQQQPYGYNPNPYGQPAMPPQQPQYGYGQQQQQQQQQPPPQTAPPQAAPAPAPAAPRPSPSSEDLQQAAAALFKPMMTTQERQKIFTMLTGGQASKPSADSDATMKPAANPNDPKALLDRISELEKKVNAQRDEGDAQLQLILDSLPAESVMAEKVKALRQLAKDGALDKNAQTMLKALAQRHDDGADREPERGRKTQPPHTNQADERQKFLQWVNDYVPNVANNMEKKSGGNNTSSNSTKATTTNASASHGHSRPQISATDDEFDPDDAEHYHDQLSAKRTRITRASGNSSSMQDEGDEKGGGGGGNSQIIPPHHADVSEVVLRGTKVFQDLTRNENPSGTFTMNCTGFKMLREADRAARRGQTIVLASMPPSNMYGGAMPSSSSSSSAVRAM